MPTIDNQNRAIFSFEIFPPKRDMSMDTIYRTLDELTDLEPDFISVTCGAGGSADGSNRRTIEVASAIQNKYHRVGIAHLPCIHFSRADVLSMLDELEKNGVRKILALRGDRVPDLTPKEREDAITKEHRAVFLHQERHQVAAGEGCPRSQHSIVEVILHFFILLIEYAVQVFVRMQNRVLILPGQDVEASENMIPVDQVDDVCHHIAAAA